MTADGSTGRARLPGAPRHAESARLVFEPPALEDAEAIFVRYAGDPDVTRFMGWPRHRSVDDTRAFLAFATAQWERDALGVYLIRARQDGRLLGSTGFALESPREAMTGYVLAKDAWGRGLATEALAAMVEIAAGVGMARLAALCHPEHRASQRVLEKCGFTHDPRRVRRLEFPNLAPHRLLDARYYGRELAGVGGADS